MTCFLPPMPPQPGPPTALPAERPKPSRRRQYAQPAQTPPSRVATILRVVAERYGIPQRAMLSRSKLPKYQRPRLVAMALCRRCTRINSEVVGEAFGRHRTTVLNAERTVARRLSIDPTFAAELGALEQTIRAGGPV
ncbi:Chromosomal replication initiator DnaA domain [Xanthobacter versatilis]|uniref:Chromosomal replication initiator DnaA domain n=1 Tax=Xanthobacter autotrophicus (strain ATCC BAA-1158 / Py2) TaxID=78245 RepID=A7INZ2_XANP2|nr:Chromosomal replication initiator DnaA domain [Xanthobacter autotrophicus Py2]